MVCDKTPTTLDLDSIWFWHWPDSVLAEQLTANYHYVCRPAHTVSKANDTVWQWWMLNWRLSDGIVYLTSAVKLSCHSHCKTMWSLLDCNSSCVFTVSVFLPLPAPLAKLSLLIACPVATDKRIHPSKAAVSFLPSNKYTQLISITYSALSTNLWKGKRFGSALSWLSLVYQ